MVVLCMSGMGCATSSLDQSRGGMQFSNTTLPIVLGVSSLEDPILADDPGIYLHDYLMCHHMVASVELLPPWVEDTQYDVDYVLSGSISVPTHLDKRSGWGTFFSVITLGGYYFLGGPTRNTEMTIKYDCSLTCPLTGEIIHWRFKDERKGRYGLYGPRSARNRKPDVYEPGWREIYFRLNDLLGEDP